MARTEWLTLGELARLARIPRDTLRAACDTGRVPCERSAKGYRLISAEAAEKLRRSGLKAFPHPVKVASETDPPREESPKRTMAAERLGLLGQPSSELQRLKEEAEGRKMQLEREQTAWELERLERERRAERRRIAEDEQQERERLEAEEQQAWLERDRAAEVERRRIWYQNQAVLAVDGLARIASWEHLGIADREVSEALHRELSEELQAFGPESRTWHLERARERAVSRVLEPLRARKKRGSVVESALRNIGSYLRDLREKGWLPPLDQRDLNLLAEQLEGPMRKILEQDTRNLTEEQAEEVLHEAIDRRLRII